MQFSLHVKSCQKFSSFRWSIVQSSFGLFFFFYAFSPNHESIHYVRTVLDNAGRKRWDGSVSIYLRV